MSSTVLIFISVNTSASGIFGVIKSTFLINSFFKILIAFSSISLAPPFAIITGSRIIFLTLIFSKAFKTFLMTSVE